MKRPDLFSIFFMLATFLLQHQTLPAQSDSTILLPRQGNARYGLIDRRGNLIVDYLYNDIGPFINGLARVNKGGATNPEGLVTGGDWGYINKKGEEIIPLVYDRAWHFGEGKAAVTQHTVQIGLPGLVKAKEPGNKTEIIREKDIPFHENQGRPISSFWNLIDTLGDFSYDKAYKNALRNGNTQQMQAPLPSSVFENKYDYVWHLQNGLAKVNIGGTMDAEGHVAGGKFGFADATGKEVVPLLYDYLWYPKDSIIVVATHTDLNKDRFKYSLLNMQGIELAQNVHDSMPQISEGKVTVRVRPATSYWDAENKKLKKVQAKWSVINSSGKVIVDSLKCEPLEVRGFHEGFVAARIDPKNLTGFRSARYGIAEPAQNKPIELAKPNNPLPDSSGDDIPTVYTTPILTYSSVYDEETSDNTEAWIFMNEAGMPDSVWYFEVHDFREGMAAVLVCRPGGNGEFHPDSLKWGFINNQLQLVIPPMFDSVADFQGETARVAVKDKWGLIDRKGKFVLGPDFDSIGVFNEGLAPVQLEGDWGFVNSAGNVVIEPQFSSVGNFINGHAYAQKDLRYGYIDTTGKFVISPVFEVAKEFQGEVAVVAIDRRWGFVNSADSFLIKDIYYKARPFREGFAAVADHNYKWNFINTKGDKITPLFKYDEIKDFYKGVAFVKRFGKWGLINAQGRELISPKYHHAEDFEKGVAKVCTGCSPENGVYKNGKWGFVNEKGKEIAPLKYTEVQGFYDGVARVKVGDLIGLIDSSGKEIIEPKCFRIDDMEDGLFKVYVGIGTPTKNRFSQELAFENAMLGYIDITGKEIVPIQYNYILESEKGVLLVYKEGVSANFINKLTGEIISPYNVLSMTNVRTVPSGFTFSWKGTTSVVSFDTPDGKLYGLVNRRGNLLIPPEYTRVWDVDDNGLAKVNKGGKIMQDSSNNEDIIADGKTGYFDRAGTMIIPPIYDEVSLLKKEKLFRVENGGLYGLLNLEGKEITPLIYQKIHAFDNARAIVQKDKKFGMINTAGNEITPPVYDEILAYKTGFSWVTKDGYVGLLDSLGYQVLEPVYDWIGSIEGEWGELRKNNKMGFYHKNGQIIAPQYDEAGNFSKGYARVKINGLWGFVNQRGMMIIPAEYEDARDFDKWFRVKKGGKWGIISEKGKKMTDFIYQKIEAPRGNAILTAREGKYRVLNPKGKEKIKEDFQQAFYTQDNYIKISDGKKWGLVDSNGKKITAIEYDVIWNYIGNYARVTKDGKWGFIDKKGEIVAPVIYDDVKSPPEGDLLIVMKDSLWGVYYDKARKKTGLIYNYTEIDYIFKMIRVRTTAYSSDSSEKKTKHGFWTFSEKYIEPSYDFILNQTSGYAYRIRAGIELPYVVVGNDKCSVKQQILTGDSCKVGIINWKGQILLPMEYQFESDIEIPSAFYIVKKDGKYGVVDSTFKFIIQTNYDYISFFDEGEGLFKVEREGLSGILNSKGKTVIPVKYQSISGFSKELFLVQKEYLSGIVNSRDEVIIPLKYKSISSSPGIMKAVRCEDDYWGYVDSASGKEIIPCQYSLIKNPSFDEQAFVKKDGKWIVIDKKGRKIIDEADGFDELEYFYGEEGDGTGIKARRKNKWGVCDWDGRVVIPIVYDFILSYKNGYAVVNNRISRQDISDVDRRRNTTKGGVWGIIDKLGNEIVPLSEEYDAARNFNGNYAPVKKNGRWGWINKSGVLAIPLKFDEFYGYQEKLALVKANTRYGFVDETGTIVIPLQYSEARGFSEGLAAVEDDYYRWGFIDKTGRNVVPPKYEFTEDFRSGLAKVNRLGRKKEIESFGLSFIESGRSGYIDTSGNEITPPEYTFATSFHLGYAIAEKNGKYERLRYEVNEKKITSVPFNYDRVAFFSNSHVIVVKNNLYGLVEIATGIETLRPVYGGINLDEEGHASVNIKGTYRRFYINDKGECTRNCENK